VFAVLGEAALGTIFSAIPNAKLVATIADLVDRHRVALLSLVTTAKSAMGATGVQHRTQRWRPTDAEVDRLRQWLADRTTTRNKLVGATRLKKLLELFTRGPIPKTEDVPGLMVRGYAAEAQEQAGIAFLGPGWVVATFAQGDRRPARFGGVVHTAVQNRYVLQNSSHAIVRDAAVHRPTGATTLVEHKDADPSGDPIEFRLRILYEASAFFRGDDAARGYDLRGDLVDATTLEVWEIKPLGSAAMGAIQSYVYKARYNDGWRTYATTKPDSGSRFMEFGRPWLAPMTIPLDRDHIAIARSCPNVNGLIVYEVYRRVRKGEEQRDTIADAMSDAMAADAVRELLRRWLWWESPVSIPVRLPDEHPGVAPPAVDVPSRGPGKESDPKGDTRPAQPPDGSNGAANDNVEGEGEREAAAAAKALAALIAAGLVTMLVAILLRMLIPILMAALALGAAAAAAGMLFLLLPHVFEQPTDRIDLAERDAKAVRETLLAMAVVRDVELAYRASIRSSRHGDLPA
jgi:hypothetical protein